MIRQPSSVTVAGPSGSGKSELVEQWLRYLNVFQVKPKKIVYAYDRWQPRFDRMQKKDEDFNLIYPVNVDDAVNLFSLPPVAGTGTAPTTTTQPVTTATQTRPVTSGRTRPVTTTTTTHHHHQPTATRHVYPNTSCHHRPNAPPHRSPQRLCRDKDHHLDGDDPQWTSQNRRQTTATTSPGALSPLARFFPSSVG